MLLIQLPIFLALFKIFSNELSNTAFASHTMLGLFDLSERSIVLALFAAVLQYIQGKISISKQKIQDKGPMASMGNMMIIAAPVITLVVLFNLPSALGVYWAISALFSIVQQIYINKHVYSADS
jgi:YidC/Oxa1 family membrane protein insertase